MVCFNPLPQVKPHEPSKKKQASAATQKSPDRMPELRGTTAVGRQCRGISAPFRDAQHTVSAPVNQCRHCDAISTSPEQFEAVSAKVREAHKAWVAAEFKKAMVHGS